MLRGVRPVEKILFDRPEIVTNRVTLQQPVAETLRPLSGVLVPIDDRGWVESVSHLPRHSPDARLRPADATLMP
jgi:hypothetical protein